MMIMDMKMMNIRDIINEEIMDTDITNIMGNIPDGYEHNILDETYQSIEEIKKLASDCCKVAAKYNFQRYNTLGYFDKIVGFRLDLLSEFGDYGELNDFIKESRINVVFNPASHVNKGGNYTPYPHIGKDNFNPKNTREINVEYDYERLKERINDYLKERVLSQSQLYTIFYLSFGETFIHELQHFHDDFRSKGTAFDSKRQYNYEGNIEQNQAKINKLYRYIKYNIQDDPKIYNILSDRSGKLTPIKKGQPIPEGSVDIGELENLFFTVNQKDGKLLDHRAALAYLRLPHEISARFSQAMANTHYYTIDITDDNKMVYSMYPMNKVIKDFARVFGNYKQLTEKQKRSLIRKVAQFWYFEQDKVNELNKQ